MSLPAQGTIKDTEFIFYYRGTKETEERYRGGCFGGKIFVTKEMELVRATHAA